MRFSQICGWGLWSFLILAVSGCDKSPSTLAPASTSALAITNLMWGFSIVAGIGFLIVEGLLVYAIIRYRNRVRDDGEKTPLPRQIEGNKAVEMVWTIVPAFLLLIIFIFTVSTLWFIKNRPTNVSTDQQVINIEVIGHQWWWEFRYPDLDITTAQEMHVPVNSLVYISVDSVDVIHSFWVPQMGGKIDVIPGHTNHSWFQPTKIGRFIGECSEYCGTEHAHMRLDVVVESQEDYLTWVEHQQSPMPTLSQDAEEGKELFLNGSCIACHSINGMESMGTAGPDLTHLGSRQDLAGAVMTNTPENLTRWLEDPSVIKPGVKMPKPNLTSEELQKIVTFLTNLK